MNDPIAIASTEPNLSALQELFTSCSPRANGWNRLADNDNVRYTLWDGQSADGKKWDKNLPEGEQAFPFDGASDCKIPLADEVINDLVDDDVEALERAMVRVQGNPETERTGQAAYARKLIEWVKGSKLYAELAREMELLSQNRWTYGATLIQVGWERTLGYRHHKVELKGLLSAAQMAAKQGSELAQQLETFVAMIQDPSLDADSAAFLQFLYQGYVQAAQPSNYQWDVQDLSVSRARKAIKELREEQVCTLPLPYLCQNEPFIRARKLWEDAFVPDTTADIQAAPAIFVVDLYTEAQLRAEAQAEGWDEDWLEEAIKHKGEFSQFTDVERIQGTRVQSLDSQFGFSTTPATDLIEVITAYRKQVDDDGVLGVYETIYHAGVTTRAAGQGELYAKHGLVDYPIGTQFPFVELRSEYNKRALCASRGVPCVVATWQKNIKNQEDSLIDRTSLETMPPFTNDYMGVSPRLGPMVEIPIKRGSQGPQFLAIPPGGKTAFELMDRIEARVDRYYGRAREGLDPSRTLIKRQKRVRKFLMSVSQALAFAFKLMAQNMPPEDIERITGVPAGQLGNPDLIADDMLYLLTFDVQEMSPDFVQLKNKALVEIAAMDSTGTIDRGKLTMHLLRSVDPALASEITTDVQGAQGQVLKGVKDDFANMALGVPSTPVENDPTSPMQLQYAQQLIEVSPKYQTLLKQDENFRQLVENWVKNRKFSLMQMENKQIGKVGVDMGDVQG